MYRSIESPIKALYPVEGGRAPVQHSAEPGRSARIQSKAPRRMLTVSPQQIDSRASQPRAPFTLTLRRTDKHGPRDVTS